MKGRLPALGALVATVAALSASCRDPKPPAPPPPPRAAAGSGHNVLLITIDTLRADHLGAYGYTRPTSPRMDGLAASGALFERAYTHWPKTRGSFVMMMTGRRASQNGYSATHQGLLDFNPTLASVLKDAGYKTWAAVDNPNVAASLGYAKGFDSYLETWQDATLATEMDRTRAITAEARKRMGSAGPWLLWLHYVNPHTPYTPPPPHDTAFLDAQGNAGPTLKVVPGFNGGIAKQWAVPGRNRLGYYVAQYDGEIAAVDREVGEVLDALAQGKAARNTVIALTSDHGESLGEHDYYFDHGQDVFDPSLHVPFILRVPGAPPGQRSSVLASTLDLLPTLLDAVKVSYPPDLAGTSLLAAIKGAVGPARPRLFAQNDRHLSAAFDHRYKVMATPAGDGRRWSLYDREKDPGETRDMARARPEEMRVAQRELELYLEQADKEWVRTKVLAGDPRESKPTPEACEQLKALGYVVAGCP